MTQPLDEVVALLGLPGLDRLLGTDSGISATNKPI
jgi:hypothetical protein